MLSYWFTLVSNKLNFFYLAKCNNNKLGSFVNKKPVLMNKERRLSFTLQTKNNDVIKPFHILLVNLLKLLSKSLFLQLIVNKTNKLTNRISK